MKPGTLIEIEWQDHTFHFGAYEGYGLAHQRSVGYLVSEDDDVIRIAQSMTTNDGDTVAKPNETLVVDKRMLLRRRVIR